MVGVAISKRIEWIDNCKGIAIFLVILGHTMRTDLSHVYIYGFHMPLFFFLSGLVCDEKKFTWNSFLKSRFNTLVLPYIVFYLFTWLYWLLVERSFRPLNMEWWQPLIGLIYGAQWHEYMSVNGILWFLPCLFTTEVLFYAVKIIPYVWMQWTAQIILACFGLLFKENLPWCLNIAFVALPFFYAGNYCRVELLVQNDTKRHTSIIAIISFVTFAFYLLLSFLIRNHVMMAMNEYGNKGLFFLLAFLGIVGFVGICKLINIKTNWGGANWA